MVPNILFNPPLPLAPITISCSGSMFPSNATLLPTTPFAVVLIVEPPHCDAIFWMFAEGVYAKSNDSVTPSNIDNVTIL